MAGNRNTLHRSKFEAFKEWLIDSDYTPIEKAADHEVLRWKVKGRVMPIIFEGKSPDHFSCNESAIEFVRKFCRETRGKL